MFRHAGQIIVSAACSTLVIRTVPAGLSRNALSAAMRSSPGPKSPATVRLPLSARRFASCGLKDEDRDLLPTGVRFRSSFDRRSWRTDERSSDGGRRPVGLITRQCCCLPDAMYPAREAAAAQQKNRTLLFAERSCTQSGHWPSCAIDRSSPRSAWRRHRRGGWRR